jgi:hypothetical protein
VLDKTSDGRCPKCYSPLLSANARSFRENVAFVVGFAIRRCQACETRFICTSQVTIPSRVKANYTVVDISLALFGGLMTCLGVALWILHRFHRWPF